MPFFFSKFRNPVGEINGLKVVLEGVTPDQLGDVIYILKFPVRVIVEEVLDLGLGSLGCIRTACGADFGFIIFNGVFYEGLFLQHHRLLKKPK